MRLKRSTFILGIAIVVLFAIGNLLPRYMNSQSTSLRASTKAFDVSSVEDGVYEGKAFLLPVSVMVRASVSAGRLESIDLLKHFNGQGKPAEAIIDRVIAKQSLGVDVVTGASYSSLTILKALENALSKGIEQ
ncbi:hypothetical protein MASR2M48_13220 [Spirochaetota bacterium]